MSDEPTERTDPRTGATIIEQPAHPGRNCTDVHPGVSHTQIKQLGAPAPPPQGRTEPPPTPPAPAPGSRRQASGPSDDWVRFDMWADRAWDLVEQAIAAAEADDTRNANAQFESELRYSTKSHTLITAAMVAQGLATASSPATMVEQMPMLDAGFDDMGGMLNG